MFHCVQSQLSQNTDLFWPCQLGCIPEPSPLPVSDAAPLQPHTKVKMLLELLQISFPGYILCSFKVFKASFKNAASCSQMAAWIYDDCKELVILRKKRFNNCNGEKKKTISVQVNAVISVTWKSDSKNPLKAFKKSARYRQDFPFCLSCPRSLAFLNALCAWGIHQTQHREAQHISILLCTSHPWGQGPVTPLSPSPIFAQHTLSSHHFFFISLFPSGNHLPWHAFSSSHLHVSCKTNSSIDFTTR